MRNPAVAGQFYPGGEARLRELIKKLAPGSATHSLKAYGVVVPHAGYVYSGGVAAETYATIEPAQTFVLIGPNHTGFGSPVSMSSEDWKTPLGVAEADRDFMRLLPPGIIDTDETAHRMEHSLEVQVPLLQYFFKDFKIVCICMGMQDYQTALEMARELASAIKKHDRRVVIVASSDFTHYEDAAVAKKKDAALVARIESLDAPGLFSEVERLNATACGYGPIGAMLLACETLGARQGKLIRYATSGDVTGDRQVVGYAGIAVV